MIAAELSPRTETPPKYGAIVIPSYGMIKFEKPEGWDVKHPGFEFNEGYRLSFFSGVVCRAAFEKTAEIWKAEGFWTPIVIGGARIFPGDPKNDGDLMKTLILGFRDRDTGIGIPEEAIIQTRDATNTYNQLLHAKKAIREHGIQGRVLTIYADLHSARVPRLVRNYRMHSDTAIAENILSEKYPKFAEVWAMIKSDPSYAEKAEGPEEILKTLLIFDWWGIGARAASHLMFQRKGADVPSIRHLQTVRNY